MAASEAMVQVETTAESMVLSSGRLVFKCCAFTLRVRVSFQVSMSWGSSVVHFVLKRLLWEGEKAGRKKSR